MQWRPFQDANVEAAFLGFDVERRNDLLRLRELIFDTSDGIAEINRLIETLKWGQPAYLPAKPKIGSTVRIGILQDDPAYFGLFFHCQTRLVGEFRELYPDRLAFTGNRAIVLRHGEALPCDVLRHCVGRALTYHSKKTVAPS